MKSLLGCPTGISNLTNPSWTDNVHQACFSAILPVLAVSSILLDVQVRNLQQAGLSISTPFIICHIMLSALTWKYIQESNHYSIPWPSFHYSYLDYGNNLLTALPICIFSLLQSILNPAAYMIKWLN